VDPYTTASPSGETPAAVSPEERNAAADYYAQAREAFASGDYRNAMRLAGHAAVDDPEDPSIHVLVMLAMFASGDHRGAAMEAHGLAAMGRIPDWDMLLDFYGNNAEPYANHLRALEKFVGENASDPDGHFLAGFHYMMEGYRDAARDEFLAALKLEPRDELAAQLLTATGGTVPADIARQLAQPPGSPGAKSPAGSQPGKTNVPATPPAPPQPPSPQRK